MSESVPGENLDIKRGSSMLPFGFARRYGVLLDCRNGSVVAMYKDQLFLSTIAEVQRFTGEVTEFTKVEESEFDEVLTKVYS